MDAKDRNYEGVRHAPPRFRWRLLHLHPANARYVLYFVSSSKYAAGAGEATTSSVLYSILIWRSQQCTFSTLRSALGACRKWVEMEGTLYSLNHLLLYLWLCFDTRSRTTMATHKLQYFLDAKNATWCSAKKLQKLTRIVYLMEGGRRGGQATISPVEGKC